MNFIVIFAVFCTLAWAGSADARKLRATPEEATECCYPRPPPKKDRGLKQHVSKCCEFPLADVWEKFSEDLQACKEEQKKKHDEEAGASSTTTEKIEGSTTTENPDDRENETEFDADDVEQDSADSEDKEEVSSTTAASHTEGRKHHKGRGNGGKGKHNRGGRGKCLKETMEKHGWSNNGTINWSVILEQTKTPSNESAADWIAPIQEAIKNCSQQEMPTAENMKGRGHHGKHHCPHHYSPEKQAFRCMANSAMMKCPDFPEDDEYCVKLREAHEKCSANPSKGPKPFQWCKKPKNKGKHSRPVA